MKKLYHGTINDFDEIDLSAGRGYRDFGKGFYATAVPSHAERLALRNKRIAEKRRSFLSAEDEAKLRKSSLTDTIYFSTRTFRNLTFKFLKKPIKRGFVLFS